MEPRDRWGRWSRRDFLRGVAAGAVGVALPVACGRPSSGSPPAAATSGGATGFFSSEEAAALGRLADFVFPPDSSGPGGSALGTVAYVEQLLTALDGTAPQLWRDGPYSGRAPWPDVHGQATTDFPSDDFDDFLPLDRVHLAGWKVRLLGSSAVGGAPNDAVAGIGPVVGQRDQMKQLLGAALAAAPSLASMDDSALVQVWGGLSAGERSLVTAFTMQAVFGAPEYGGNVKLGGWAQSHFPGDQLPFGYCQYDAETGTLVERADLPLTKADPTPDPDPMDSTTLALLDSLAAGSGGRKYY